MKEFTTSDPLGAHAPWGAPGDLPWRKHAACRGTDTELFFPAGALSPDAVEQIEAAKAVCLRCAVRLECLEFALQSNQEAGVWGGLSEEERRKMRRPWLRARRLAALRLAAGRSAH